MAGSGYEVFFRLCYREELIFDSVYPWIPAVVLSF